MIDARAGLKVVKSIAARGRNIRQGSGLRTWRQKARTSFGPVVTGAALAKDKVVRSEEGTKGSRADGVHLEVDQDGPLDPTSL